MTNSVARKPNTTPALDEDEDVANTLAESEGSIRLMKFKKGKFYQGENEVALNTEYVAHCRARKKGWVKFVDNKKVDDRTRRAGDKSIPLVRHNERELLGDLDKSQWPLDDDGEPQDPWSFQHYLPLENVETGNLFLFVSGSAGGGIAVDEICDKWARNNLAGRARRGLPTVALRVGTFDTKKYKNTLRPEFVIVGWENGDDNTVTVMPSPKGGPSTDVIDDEPDLSDVPHWVTEDR